MDDRGVHDAAEHDPERPAVVVDDVEVPCSLEARERVAELELRDADHLGWRLVEDRHELRLRAGVARGEKRDLVSGPHEALSEERDDPFDPAVARRRNRKPHRAEDGDSHSDSTSICPFSSRTSQLRSKARTPDSVRPPSQAGNSCGAVETSAFAAGSGRSP